LPRRRGAAARGNDRDQQQPLRPTWPTFQVRECRHGCTYGIACCPELPDCGLSPHERSVFRRAKGSQRGTKPRSWRVELSQKPLPLSRQLPAVTGKLFAMPAQNCAFSAATPRQYLIGTVVNSFGRREACSLA
jgi:hypothetical protein